MDKQAIAEKNGPIGSFIVQYCNGNETGYTNYIASIFVMGACGNESAEHDPATVRNDGDGAEERKEPSPPHPRPIVHSD